MINLWHCRAKIDFVVPEEARRLVLLKNPKLTFDSKFLFDPQYNPQDYSFQIDKFYQYNSWSIRRFTDQECFEVFPMVGLGGIFDNINIFTTSSTFIIEPYSAASMHVDTRYTVNVNFLIDGDAESRTSSYAFNEGYGIPEDCNSIEFAHYVRNNPDYKLNMKVLGHYSQDYGDVYVLNSRFAHDVLSFSNKPRVVFSAGFHPLEKTTKALDKLYYQLVERFANL